MLRRAHSAVVNLAARLVHLADGTAARRAELDRFDYLPREEQQRIVMSRLRRLLAHAFERVPYYAEVAQQRRLKPEHFQTFDDLPKLPLLTKEIIRRRRDHLIAHGGPSKGIKASFTGGSTGAPLSFLLDQQYRAYGAADKARCYERCEYGFGEPLVFIWGSDYDSAAHKSLPQKLFDRIGRNLLWVDTFSLSEEVLKHHAERIVAHDPVLIVGYVASLTMYARFLRTCGGRRPSPRALQATAETLTQPDRKLLEETFDCRVFDRYGGREVGLIAHECEAHEGLHLSPMCNLTEVVDVNDKPVAAGQTGRIVVTNLHNYAMPFIRYEVEDMAVPGERFCSCGRATPLLERIVGRTADVIISPSGKLIPGEFFIHNFGRLLFGRDIVKQYQVVQETRTDLTIRLVPSEGADVATLQNELTDMIHQHADREFVLTFEICESIPASSSGKYRFTISKLEQPFAISSRTSDLQPDTDE